LFFALNGDDDFVRKRGVSHSRLKTDYDRSANFGQYKTYSWQTS